MVDFPLRKLLYYKRKATSNFANTNLLSIKQVSTIMSEEIQLVAIFHPTPGKETRVRHDFPVYL